MSTMDEGRYNGPGRTSTVMLFFLCLNQSLYTVYQVAVEQPSFLPP